MTEWCGADVVQAKLEVTACLEKNVTMHCHGFIGDRSLRLETILSPLDGNAEVNLNVASAGQNL